MRLLRIPHHQFGDACSLPNLHQPTVNEWRSSIFPSLPDHALRKDGWYWSFFQWDKLETSAECKICVDFKKNVDSKHEVAIFQMQSRSAAKRHVIASHPLHVASSTSQDQAVAAGVIVLQYNYNFFRAVKAAKSYSSPNKRRKATDSTFAHQDEVTRFFTAGMATSSMCPSTFDNFYIRRGIQILRQEYILPHRQAMENHMLEMAGVCVQKILSGGSTASGISQLLCSYQRQANSTH